MSVTFYCTAWAFAQNQEDLNKITDEQLTEIAIKPRNSEDEGQAWLIEARKERAGKIQQKEYYWLKIYAGGANGQCLYINELSIVCPNVLFVTISGEDCFDNERIDLIKNGTISSCNGVLNKEPFLSFVCGLKVHPYYLVGDELLSKIENTFFKMKTLNGDFEDAFRQDDHEDLEN